MGVGASNPVAQMAAKKQANDALDQAKDGLKSVAGAKSEKEKERERRSKDQLASYEDKKREREERKKKLAEMRAAHQKR